MTGRRARSSQIGCGIGVVMPLATDDPEAQARKRLLAIPRPSASEGPIRMLRPVAAKADWSYSHRIFESLYQSFEDRADPSQGAIRIAALRPSQLLPLIRGKASHT